jgi:hypothetical protein
MCLYNLQKGPQKCQKRKWILEQTSTSPAMHLLPSPATTLRESPLPEVEQGGVENSWWNQMMTEYHPSHRRSLLEKYQQRRYQSSSSDWGRRSRRREVAVTDASSTSSPRPLRPAIRRSSSTTMSSLGTVPTNWEEYHLAGFILWLPCQKSY